MCERECVLAGVYGVFHRTDSGWQIAAGRTDCDEHSCTHADTYASGRAATNKIGLQQANST